MKQLCLIYKHDPYCVGSGHKKTRESKEIGWKFWRTFFDSNHKLLIDFFVKRNIRRRFWIIECSAYARGCVIRHCRKDQASIQLLFSLLSTFQTFQINLETLSLLQNYKTWIERFNSNWRSRPRKSLHTLRRHFSFWSRGNSFHFSYFSFCQPFSS